MQRFIFMALLASLLNVLVTQSAHASDMRGQLFYVVRGDIYTWDGESHTMVLDHDDPYTRYEGLQLSPDGATLAFFADEQRPKLHLMDVATGEIIALPGTREVEEDDPAGMPLYTDAYHRRPVFSPDGLQLAYWESFGVGPLRIRVHDIATGETRTLTDEINGQPLPLGFLGTMAHSPYPRLHWGTHISYATISHNAYGNRMLRMFDPQTGDYSEYQYSQEGTVMNFHGWHQMSDGTWLVHVSARDADTPVHYLVDPLVGEWYRIEDELPPARTLKLADEPADALRVHTDQTDQNEAGQNSTLTIIAADDTHIIDFARYAIRPDGQALALFAHLDDAPEGTVHLDQPNLYLWQPDEGYTLLREFEEGERMRSLPEVVWGVTETAFPDNPARTPADRPFVLGETGIPETPVLFSGEITLQPGDIIDIETGDMSNTNDPIDLGRQFGRQWWEPAEFYFRVDESGDRMLSTLPPMYPFPDGSPDEPRTPQGCPIFRIAGEFRIDFRLDNLTPDEVYCFATSEGNSGYFHLITDTRNRDTETIDELTVKVHVWCEYACKLPGQSPGRRVVPHRR